MEVLLIVGYISFCIAFLSYVIVDCFSFKKRMRNEADEMAQEVQRLFKQHPECKNLKEVKEKIKHQQIDPNFFKSYPSKQKIIQYLTEQQNKLIEASRVLNKKIQELNNQEDEENKKHNS